jgi:putative tryptophan/tyrosine transport system substrate-binding protein
VIAFKHLLELQWGDRMKRREFIALVGAGAVVWPLATRSQQAERVRRVAYVAFASPVSELAANPLSKAFLQALRELGYVEGRNLVVEWRSAEGNYDNLPEIIRQLVANNVDVIVSPNNPVTEVAKSVTSTVPIVMVANSIPVELGYVQSLARPGGNITGLSWEANFESPGKRLEIMRELLPGATRLAYLLSAEISASQRQFVEVTSRKLGFNLLVAEHTPKSYTGAFALITKEHAEALFVAGGGANYVNRHLIADFAAQSRLPAIYDNRDSVDAGGLICFGTSGLDLRRRAAVYVDKILKGAKPADLPVEQPTKYELVINLKAAKTLGLTVPPPLLARADEVIE